MNKTGMITGALMGTYSLGKETQFKQESPQIINQGCDVSE